MSMFGKIMGQVQGYAQQNPGKVRAVTDKAARFVDQRTKGKYRNQIDNAVRKVNGVIGGGRPQPRRGDARDDPRNS